MTRSPWFIVVAHLARVALGVIFLLAAALKVADIALFVEQIRDYDIAPAHWAPLLARFFLVVEFALGFGLIAGFKPRWTIPASAALLVMFMTAIGWAWAHGYEGSCGCFGSHGIASGPKGALLEDSLFLLIGLVAWLGLRHRDGGQLGWQRLAMLAGAVIGLVLPPIAGALPIDGLVTASKTGADFDHIIVEGFDGDIHDGEYLFALLDPDGAASAAAVERLNAFDEEDDLPQIVGVAQGNNDALVEFMLEHDAWFEMGYAPSIALRRFYRTMPVFLYVVDGVIGEAWFGMPPDAAAVRAAAADQ